MPDNSPKLHRLTISCSLDFFYPKKKKNSCLNHLSDGTSIVAVVPLPVFHFLKLPSLVANWLCAVKCPPDI